MGEGPQTQLRNNGPLIVLVLVISAALSGLIVLACAGGDDDNLATTPPVTSTTSTATTPSPAASASASPATSPSATATATVPVAQSLARNAGYILYVAGPDDTVQGVAAAFGPTPGQPDADFVDRLKQENELTEDALTEGTELAVPVLLPGEAAIVPETSLQAALGIGVEGQGGPLLLMQPSQEMRDGFLGKLLLHQVELATATPSLEGFGYVMEYWTADRTVMKGGTFDPEARIAEAQFIVAAGSMARELTSERPGDLHSFTRDGVTYTVKLLARSPTAAQLAAMLEPAEVPAPAAPGGE